MPPRNDAAKAGWPDGALILLVAAWTASLGNLPLWRELHAVGALDGAAGLGFGLCFAVAIGALVGVLGSLFAWKGWLKPGLTVLLLLQGFGLHFMLSYRVIIDPTMMMNVVQTDPREVRDLADGPLLFNLAWGVLPPLALLWWLPSRRASLSRRLARNLLRIAGLLLLAVVMIVLAFQPLSSTMRNHKSLRYLINPLNIVYAVGSVAAEPLKRARGPLRPLGTDATLAAARSPGAKAPLVLLVLGETGRSGNFGLNGYARDTTPQLAKVPGLVSFTEVESCGTSTAASVPCMFSHLGRSGWADRDADHENLLDVLQRAGLAVLWVDNQAGCKGVCARVPTVSTLRESDPVLCGDSECHDEIMLRDLDAHIAALPAERRARGVVVVLHAMGSHGPAYFRRSPPAFKRFLPECSSVDLQSCSREAVVNAYDNTIVYTDHVLARMIEWLQARGDRADTAMVYLADHGESLGENNLYLHGLPFAIAPREQTHVPWITWMSPAFAQHRQRDLACLARNAGTALSHDHWFHSVLGLLDVRTSVYRPALDAYAACRSE